MSKPLTHILVIRFSAMGDVAMTVPVLRALSRQYPNVKITVLTREFFTPIFRDIPNVSVFPADLKGKHKGLLGLFRLSKELKAFKVDAVADLHNVLRTHILKLFFLGTKWIKIDKGRTEKKALISGNRFEQLKTTHQRYADVFEQLGFIINLERPLFPKAVSINEKTKLFLGDSNKKRIGIAPFAAHESKMYPLHLMKEVIEVLSKNYQIILFGGGIKEEALLNDFVDIQDGVKNITGQLSLNEELDVISNLDAMLSMDSGNAHLAAMFGIPTITLWGVTHPFAGFYPFNQNPENALLADRTTYPKIPTSVYGNTFPEGYQDAIKTISPQQIISKLNTVLQ